MFLTKIQSQGLPQADGSVRAADTVFEFSFCLAAENDYRWLMGIESVQEDRVTYLPASAPQGEWIDAQADLMSPSGIGLSWWFRNAAAAFEFVERLGPCRLGAPLQERLTADGGDIVAPPPEVAEDMLGRATDAFEQGRLAAAFDIATRLLAGEGFRVCARQLRQRVLTRFGCGDDARREADILALLGADALPHHAPAMPAAEPAVETGYRAVAVELQGLPLHFPAVDNPLVRYLYRIDVPHDSAALPWLIRLPAIPHGSGGEPAAELPEQEAWLKRSGATQIDGGWEVRGEPAQESFIAAVQNGLAVTDRWGLLARIRLAEKHVPAAREA